VDFIVVKNKLLAPLGVEEVFGIVINELSYQPSVSLT
jgi:hypothetical protein